MPGQDVIITGGSIGGLIVALLPVAALAVLWLALRRRFDARRALLLAATLWGAAAVAITEGLSGISQVTPVMVAVAWLAVAAAAIAWRFVLAKENREPTASWRTLSAMSQLLLVGLAVLSLATLVTALIGPPNNWDSMTYHMPRIAHWIQQRSVAFFPTGNPRQNHLNPGAEFLILQFQILCGGDRLANLPQWMAMIGCAAGASLIASQLGARPRGQVLAAVFCASVPMMVLQTANAQNDIELAFWLICFVSFLLWGMQAAGREMRWAIAGAGLSLGLATLTKATGYLFALPWCVWFAVVQLQRQRLAAMPMGLAIAVLALLPNLGHSLRNAHVYGSPLGPSTEVGTFYTFHYTNQPIGVKSTISGVVRNVALQLTVPSAQLTGAVQQTVKQLLGALGINPNDPATTWTSLTFRLDAASLTSTNGAGSPLHVLLILAASITLLKMRGEQRKRCVLCLACVAGGFVLFCGVLVWQPWHARLHLPLLALAAAPVAAIVDATWNSRAGNVAAFALVAWALALAPMSDSHPWLGQDSIFSTSRFDQYFCDRREFIAPYRTIADLLRASHPSRIGLASNNNEMEYPIWAMTRAVVPEAQLEHVGVTNISRAAQAGTATPFVPQLVIVLKSDVGALTVRPGDAAK